MKKIIRSLSIWFLICSGLIFSCKKDTVPSLTTSEITNFRGTSASGGGTVIDEGSGRIIVRGVCWSTDQHPTLSNNKTQDGDGVGKFISEMTNLDLATTYYVRAYASNNAGTGYGNEISFTNPTVPSINTIEASLITYNSAASGGNIINDGGSPVLSRGICWNTNHNPSITNNVILNGSGTGMYTSYITGLLPEITYYVRAFATGSLGTFYGNEISFVYHYPNCGTIFDADGNVYNTVIIGSQCWMRENLKTTKYNNGDLIGTTYYATLDISGEDLPKYQWPYDGNEANVNTYGRLYTWNTVTDVRNVCPSGWHLPSQTEWRVLEDYLSNNGYGYEESGNKIGKSLAAGFGWSTSFTAGDVGNDLLNNNISGFTGLPGGYRVGNGTFQGFGEHGLWSTAYYKYISTLRHNLDFNSSTLGYGDINTDLALSTRCLFGQSQLCNILNATNITSSGATLNGLVNANNLSTVVTFDFDIYPYTFRQSLIASQSPVSGKGINNVSANISNLEPGTRYYFRIKTESTTSIVYSDILCFTTVSGIVADVEGNNYNTISLGSQEWMAENLRTMKYSNGDYIGTTIPARLDISNEIYPKYQWACNGDENTVQVFGRLYTYFTATDNRNVCPTGWHVPSDEEWTTLTDFLRDNGYGAGGDDIAKSMAAQTGWEICPLGSTVGFHQGSNNWSGFAAPAGGLRQYHGEFPYFGSYGYWLSSTEMDIDNVKYFKIYGWDSKPTRYYDSKRHGYSIRCLRDN
jgi:uncharacterized protein (TIGR02145 family)